MKLLQGLGVKIYLTASDKMDFQKKIAGVLTVLGGLFASGSAYAVATTTADLGVEITEGNLASTTGYIGELFADLGPFIWLAIGIPLGFYVIKRVTSLVRGRMS